MIHNTSHIAFYNTVLSQLLAIFNKSEFCPQTTGLLRHRKHCLVTTWFKADEGKETVLNKLKSKHTAHLLHMIASDIKAATGSAHAAAKAAETNARVGRMDDAMQSILEVEPKIYDAQKLLTLSTYVSQIGRYQEETE